MYRYIKTTLFSQIRVLGTLDFALLVCCVVRFGQCEPFPLIYKIRCRYDWVLTVPLCTPVYPCVPLCTPVYSCVPLCTPVYSCVLIWTI
jgi:hypothetical protein